ncbi:hypothetical protein ACF5W4_03820 [Bacillota bacterium Lsc_1132]
MEIEPAIATRYFSVTIEEMEQAVHILQSLDQIGVGARNFVDCLLIQMRSKSGKTRWPNKWKADSSVVIKGKIKHSSMKKINKNLYLIKKSFSF